MGVLTFADKFCIVMRGVVEIEHWCEPEGRIAARFDYIIDNLSSGEVIGRATSKWLMLNKDTCKPQKINNQVRDEFLAFCSKSSRLAFAEENNRGLEKIPQLDEPAEYSRLSLLSMPQDIFDKYELQSITIDYCHNCQFDDSLDSYTSTEIEKEDLNGFSDDLCLLDSNPNPGRYRPSVPSFPRVVSHRARDKPWSYYLEKALNKRMLNR
ncbi:oleoyl-acyl carrier protein thioesterase 1 [Carex littledalei]|uniref:Acyl-[acyl-carrier-protein] hydrolase n=1 Tax=Carex littledalei TaxID=544730 RepID=A0A833QXE1_9POAL|nr:oleoyl-acyl carrier protein thioesterase 1 [Carex littledalei]